MDYATPVSEDYAEDHLGTCSYCHSCECFYKHVDVEFHEDPFNDNFKMCEYCYNEIDFRDPCWNCSGCMSCLT